MGNTFSESERPQKDQKIIKIQDNAEQGQILLFPTSNQHFDPLITANVPK